MRVLLLIATSVLSGCATTAVLVPPGDDGKGRPLSTANAAPVRTTGGGRTQSVGLPFSRGGKIGLWVGVAVFLAYLMHSDGEEDVSGSGDP
jgi:uncharacterized protein YceK